MKTTAFLPALAAIVALALVSAPVCALAQTTDTPTAPAATTTPTPSTSPTTTATKPVKTKVPRFSGILTAVDTTANTITVATSKKDPSKTITLSIASTAKIQKDRKAATLADFAVGQRVSGTYTKDASGTSSALTLNYYSAQQKKHKAAATASDTTAAPAAPAPTSAPAMPPSQ